jgi:hypothetical protein
VRAADVLDVRQIRGYRVRALAPFVEELDARSGNRALIMLRRVLELCLGAGSI